ncbi:MAG: hypothetical protein ACKOUS_18495 [Alphaproteobacteria bacterium]
MIRVIAPLGVERGSLHLTHGDNQFWILVDGEVRDRGETAGDPPLQRSVEFDIPRDGAVRVQAILNNYEGPAHLAGHLRLAGKDVHHFNVRHDWPVRGICHVQDFLVSRNGLFPAANGTSRFACTSDFMSRICPRAPALLPFEHYACEVELCRDGATTTYNGTFLVPNTGLRARELECQLLKADGAFDLELVAFKANPYSAAYKQVLVRYINRGPVAPGDGEVVVACRLTFGPKSDGE